MMLSGGIIQRKDEEILSQDPDGYAVNIRCISCQLKFNGEGEKE